MSSPTPSTSALRPARPSPPTPSVPADDDAPSSDEDAEDGVGLEGLKSFASQVQRAPGTATGKVIIPKRGEKDFEPLNQTVNIQSKMLNESRQALFSALEGVRGTSSKSLSHALLSPTSPFPIVKIVRGNMFSTMSHTIRPAPSPPSSTTDQGKVDKGKGKASTTELLPEEALYLIERGSMVLWVKDASSSVGGEEGDEEWKEEIQGFEGAIEMSVMQAFGQFIGREGLSLEMYQVYASLKRLGYTVHRRERFLPYRFQNPPSSPSSISPPRPSTSSASPSVFLQSLRNWLSGLLTRLGGLWPGRKRGPRVGVLKGRGETLLGGFVGSTYTALYAKLRLLPAGWHSSPISLPLTSPPAPQETTDQNRYDCLQENPYIPFWHVWKPSTKWTRAGWDKGRGAGVGGELAADYWVGVVDARTSTFPTLEQLADIFPTLPTNPIPYFRPRFARPPPSSPSLLLRTLRRLRLAPQPDPAAKPPAQQLPPQKNLFTHLKQGDRTLIVGVVDGGNVGWVRMGRGGFEAENMVF